MFSYAPQSASLLPLTLHEAAQGRAAPLMAQAEMILGQIGEQIMHGMQLSVMCSEDGDRLVSDPADAQTVLGTEFVEFSRAQCAVWPRGERPRDFHAPLASDAPILLLSGEFDPVTPPRYGDAVLRRLADVNAPDSSQGELSAARHLVLTGQGHNVIGVGCMPKLMARFIDSADARALEAECLDQLAATPAFAGFYGWEP
jgi:pimeloyl-ACP methyl ester carboxylesterase